MTKIETIHKYISSVYKNFQTNHKEINVDFIRDFFNENSIDVNSIKDIVCFRQQGINYLGIGLLDNSYTELKFNN